MMDDLFYPASKIGWALLSPETLLTFLVAAGFVALARGHSRAALLLMGATAILLIAIAIFPLANFILAPLEAAYPANPYLRNVKAIIILGGGSNPEVAKRWGTPTVNEAGDRLVAGASLARDFPRARVYFTGGTSQLRGKGISEAVLARRILINAGVDPQRIITEGASRSTAENARMLRAIVGTQSDGGWVLVTSAFHMPRAMQTFCAAGWAGLIAYPTDYRTPGFADGIGWNLADHLSDINLGAKEWVGLLAYRLTGRANRSC